MISIRLGQRKNAEKMMDRTNMMLESSRLEQTAEWIKWTEKIPSISFPSDWKIKIIPPFSGAIVRFQVTKSDSNKNLSIYLDCYEILAFFGEPYWELYPYEGDTFRCKMADTDKLLEAIMHSFDEPENSND